jgi:chitinase
LLFYAPQAPYFASENYRNGAYIAVDMQAGSSIDFYNVQFYNQGDTTYDSYEKLFLESDGYFSRTSVK